MNHIVNFIKFYLNLLKMLQVIIGKIMEISVIVVYFIIIHLFRAFGLAKNYCLIKCSFFSQNDGFFLIRKIPNFYHVLIRFPLLLLNLFIFYLNFKKQNDFFSKQFLIRSKQLLQAQNHIEKFLIHIQLNKLQAGVGKKITLHQYNYCLILCLFQDLC